MKDKFRLWLNIVTICLCVCAVAIGVYAATTATLNVGGKIAFTAHNCDVSVTGTIYGHATGNTADGLPVAEADAESLSTVTLSGNSGNMDLGSRYFTDMASTDGSVEDIIVTLVVTNDSKFDITASVTSATATSPVSITASESSQTVAKNANVTFVFTITLTSTKDDIKLEDLSADNVSIVMKFDKYIESDFSVNADGQLITTMGHATPTDIATDYEDVAIEWFAFAVKGENLGNSTSITVGDDTWYSLSGVNMNNVTYTGKTFWFIQRYVTAGGYVSTSGSTITGQVFDADGISNDYDQSDICAYLSATGAYITTSVTGIADTDLYTKITERSVSETYTVDGSSQDNTFSSRLWLLSKTELALLGSTGSEPVKAYGIGNTVGNSGDGARWWLRSSYSRDVYLAYYVDYDGNLFNDSVDDVFGVRAAFEITMP